MLIWDFLWPFQGAQKYFVWTSYPRYLNIYSAIKSCSLAVKDHFFSSKSLGSENIRSSFMACSECLIVSLWCCELRRLFRGSRPAKNRFYQGDSIRSLYIKLLTMEPLWTYGSLQKCDATSCRVHSVGYWGKGEIMQLRRVLGFQLASATCPA